MNVTPRGMPRYRVKPLHWNCDDSCRLIEIGTRFMHVHSSPDGEGSLSARVSMETEGWMLRLACRSERKIRILGRDHAGATHFEHTLEGASGGLRSFYLRLPLGVELDLTIAFDGELWLTAGDLAYLPRLQVARRQAYADAVVAGMAAIPSRATSMRAVVDRLLPQIDHLFVYLNNFPDIPAYLNHPQITVYRSQDFGDYRDNSKFFGLYQLTEPVYFFSVDDDIEYPEDYVARLVSRIERYGRHAAVGVHGSIYGASSIAFRDRAVVHFQQAMEFDLPVPVLGTGTFAFHSDTIRPESLKFAHVGMADLIVANLLREKGVPALSVERQENWLRPFDEPAGGTGTNLFSESIVINSPQDKYIAAYGIAGFKEVRAAISSKEGMTAQLEHAAMSYLDFGVAMEEGVEVRSVGVAPNVALYALANKLPWDAFRLACMRSSLGLRLSRYVRESRMRQDTPVARSKLVDFIREQVGTLPATIGDGSAVQEIAFSSEDVLTNGDRHLAAAVDAMEFLENPWDDSRRRRVFSALVAARQEDLAEELFHEIERRGATGPAVEFEYAQLLLKTGKTRDVLTRMDDLLSLGSNGRELVAMAGVLEEATWAEDLVLEVLVGSVEKREIRRMTAFANLVRRVHLSGISEARWARQVKRMNPQVAMEAAGILLAHRHWPQNLEFDQFKVADPIERELWQSAVDMLRTGEPETARAGLNSLFLSTSLSPVAISEESNAGFFHRLRGLKTRSAFSSDAPLVSVLMSTFNSSETLEYSLRSIQGQVYPNLELVLVDDCSNDPVVVPDWFSERVPTRVVRMDKNSGPYVCRNEGLKVCNGAFVATHDADDWMHPLKIERQMAHLLESNVLACYTKHVRLFDDGVPALENHGKFLGDGPITSLFRREVFDKIGDFMPVRTRGDVEYKARLISIYRATSIISDPAVTLLALESNNSNSKRFMKSIEDEHVLGLFKRWYALEHEIAYLRGDRSTPRKSTPYFNH